MRNFFTALFCIPVICFAQIKTVQSDWQQQVDYKIDVTLNDKTHELQGNIEMVYTNNSPDILTKMYIHLWPNAYQPNTAFAKQQLSNKNVDFYFAHDSLRGSITKMDFKQDGQPCKLILDVKNPDIGKITLAEPIQPGKSTVISTPFTVKIPGSFSRCGHVGQEYQLTQWYPKPAVYDVNKWNPMPYLDQGEFYSEFGSFEVSITTPKEYRIAATGLLQDKLEQDWLNSISSNGIKKINPNPAKGKTKTITFKQDNIHDFAWFASRQFLVSKRVIKTPQGSPVEAYVFAASEQKVRKRALDAIQTAIDYYSTRVGEYPYQTVSVVKGPIEAGGGMEYPTVTVVAVLDEEVIVHEVGHNWFYGILGNNERTYPWMDESINSYYENQGLKKEDSLTHFGDRLNDNIMKALAKNEIANARGQAVNTSSEELTGINYGVIVYGKGAIILQYLEQYLGTALYDECMHQYYNTWKFKHPLPGDLQRSFEKTSGKSLDWFFNGLLNDVDPDLALRGSLKRPVVISHLSYAIPVLVTYSLETGDTSIWFDVKEGKTEITPLKGCQKMMIDPSQNLLERNANNNGLRKGLFPAVEPIKIRPFNLVDHGDKSEVSLFPLMGYNYFNKFMFGGFISNKTVSRKKVEWFMAPLYSNQTSTINGFSSISYKCPTSGLDFGVKARRFAFAQQQTTLLYTYNKIQPYLSVPFPSKNLNHPVKQWLNADLNYQIFDPLFSQEEERISSNNPNAKFQGNRYFINLRYTRKNTNAVDPNTLNVMLTFGSYDITNLKGTFDTSRRLLPNYDKDTEQFTFVKLTADWRKKFAYNSKNKGLTLRLFGGTMLDEAEDATLMNYGFSTSNQGGIWDYQLTDAMIHRNAQDGFWKQQISPNEANSKSIETLATNVNWMFSANASSTIPGKIPLKLYAEVTTWDGIETAYFNRTESVKFIYNAGIEIGLLKGNAAVYIPLIQSAKLTKLYEDLGYSFGQRITFTLNLEGLNPFNAVKQIKLF